MIGAKDLATVLEWTAATGTTVTLIGDTLQLQAVNASGLFGRLHAMHPGAELAENLRQQTDVGRECAALARRQRRGSPPPPLADAGQLIVATSQTHKLLIDAWAERAAAAPTAKERIQEPAWNRPQRPGGHPQRPRPNRGTRARMDRSETTTTPSPSVIYAEETRSSSPPTSIDEPDPSRQRHPRPVTAATDRTDISYWDEQGEHTDHLTARQAVTHARTDTP
jgi:hypothetical protein